MIPSKYIFAFDMQTKTVFVKRLKYSYIVKYFYCHRQTILYSDDGNVNTSKYNYNRFVKNVDPWEIRKLLGNIKNKCLGRLIA